MILDFITLDRLAYVLDTICKPIQPYIMWAAGTTYAGAQTQLFAATSPDIEKQNLR